MHTMDSLPPISNDEFTFKKGTNGSTFRNNFTKRLTKRRNSEAVKLVTQSEMSGFLNGVTTRRRSLTQEFTSDEELSARLARCQSNDRKSSSKSQSEVKQSSSRRQSKESNSQSDQTSQKLTSGGSPAVPTHRPHRSQSIVADSAAKLPRQTSKSVSRVKTEPEFRAKPYSSSAKSADNEFRAKSIENNNSKQHGGHNSTDHMTENGTDHKGTKLKQDNGTEYKTSKSKGGRRSSSAGLVSRGHSSENDNSLADQISEVDHEKELLKNPTQSSSRSPRHYGHRNKMSDILENGTSSKSSSSGQNKNEKDGSRKNSIELNEIRETLCALSDRRASCSQERKHSCSSCSSDKDERRRSTEENNAPFWRRKSDEQQSQENLQSTRRKMSDNQSPDKQPSPRTASGDLGKAMAPEPRRKFSTSFKISTGSKSLERNQGEVTPTKSKVKQRWQILKHRRKSEGSALKKSSPTEGRRTSYPLHPLLDTCQLMGASILDSYNVDKSISPNILNAPDDSTVQCCCGDISCPFCNLLINLELTCPSSIE